PAPVTATRIVCAMIPPPQKDKGQRTKKTAIFVLRPLSFVLCRCFHPPELLLQYRVACVRSRAGRRGTRRQESDDAWDQSRDQRVRSHRTVGLSRDGQPAGRV